MLEGGHGLGVEPGRRLWHGEPRPSFGRKGAHEPAERAALHSRTPTSSYLKRSVSSASGLAPPRDADCAAVVDEEAITTSGRLFCPIPSIRPFGCFERRKR